MTLNQRIDIILHKYTIYRWVRSMIFKYKHTLYGQFWVIYFTQMFDNDFNFKFIPQIHVFYMGDVEELRKANIHTSPNLFYDSTRKSLIIINDSDAMIKYASYRITLLTRMQI